jgi:hypothetical protein
LTHIFSEFFGDQAGRCIGCTAWSKANEQGDGPLGREILSAGNTVHKQGRGGYGNGAEQVAFVHV